MKLAFVFVCVGFGFIAHGAIPIPISEGGGPAKVDRLNGDWTPIIQKFLVEGMNATLSEFFSRTDMAVMEEVNGEIGPINLTIQGIQANITNLDQRYFDVHEQTKKTKEDITDTKATMHVYWTNLNAALQAAGNEAAVRYTSLSNQVADVKGIVNTLDAKIASLDGKMEAKLTNLETKMDQMSGDINSIFEILRNRTNAFRGK